MRPTLGWRNVLGVPVGCATSCAAQDCGERRAYRLEAADEVRPGGVADVLAVRGAQLADHGAQECRRGRRTGLQQGEGGEDGEQGVPLGRRGGRDRGEDRGVHRVPGEQVEPLGDHAGRGRDARRGSAGPRTAAGSRRSRRPRPRRGRRRAGTGGARSVASSRSVRRDRVEHLDARVDRAALLQPGVPGDADPGELGELLAPQAGGAAAGARRQADVLRADPLPAGAQERGELGRGDAAVAVDAVLTLTLSILSS